MSREREDRNKELIRQAFDDWAAGTGGVFGLLADNATWAIVGNPPASRTYHSRDELLGKVINPFNARLSTPQVHDGHDHAAQVDHALEKAGRVGDACRCLVGAYFLHLQDADAIFLGAEAEGQ